MRKQLEVIQTMLRPAKAPKKPEMRPAEQGEERESEPSPAPPRPLSAAEEQQRTQLLEAAQDIDKKLQEDVARPIIFHSRQGTCWKPYVKGVTVMVNSSYNGYRYEDVWLDK